MDKSPISVLPGTHSKHVTPVLCLGPFGGVVKGKLNRLSIQIPATSLPNCVTLASDFTSLSLSFLSYKVRLIRPVTELV